MEKEVEYSSANGDGGDESEWKKVALMRVYVEGQDPAAKEVDNFMIRRFLRARDLDIEKASTMFLKYLKWRKEAVPNGFISDEEVQNELDQKKMFLQGYDKQGRPIGVVFGGKHYSAKRQLDEFKRFVVYVLDKMCSRMPSGQEKFIAIADVQGWGYSNCDIRAYLAALEIMQNYYPERLGKVFLIHVPYLFMKAWKIVYPFIDNNTKKKFVFVDDKNLKSTLLADIDENQLPDIYGGKLKLVPIDA
ncbi:CRAL-TRIO domain-containing protein-like [Iris pallida]|uniref:CRAL-TRIO domain-containing protein-like n=1 Tax=Iris pallida TaxID=29817 RepID=A0AAX6I3W5_IRIPA|nr:CRAL-TRIO domain-containing protein-like [Iris pallida]